MPFAAQGGCLIHTHLFSRPIRPPSRPPTASLPMPSGWLSAGQQPQHRRSEHCAGGDWGAHRPACVDQRLGVLPYSTCAQMDLPALPALSGLGGHGRAQHPLQHGLRGFLAGGSAHLREEASGADPLQGAERGNGAPRAACAPGPLWDQRQPALSRRGAPAARQPFACR
uniref:Uncharacterized protein n=1 Tax=Tetraselmis sp. GSL018 TaxID=582737 RepID=A0A061QJH9_9CHLO